jgi:hypothetical protein
LKKCCQKPDLGPSLIRIFLAMAALLVSDTLNIFYIFANLRNEDQGDNEDRPTIGQYLPFSIRSRHVETHEEKPQQQILLSKRNHVVRY